MTKKSKLHTAQYLQTSFHDSKRSQKKIHKINGNAMNILGYVCRSIDKHYKKTKTFQTKLYHSQIASYCHISPDTVERQLPLLVRKKLLIYDADSHLYQVGWTLKAWTKIISPTRILRVAQEDPQFAGSTRRPAKCGLSNITNSTNANIDNQKPQEPKSIEQKINEKKKADEAKKDWANLKKTLIVNRANYDTTNFNKKKANSINST